MTHLRRARKERLCWGGLILASWAQHRRERSWDGLERWGEMVEMGPGWGGKNRLCFATLERHGATHSHETGLDGAPRAVENAVLLLFGVKVNTVSGLYADLRALFPGIDYGMGIPDLRWLKNCKSRWCNYSEKEFVFQWEKMTHYVFVRNLFIKGQFFIFLRNWELAKKLNRFFLAAWWSTTKKYTYFFAFFGKQLFQ